MLILRARAGRGASVAGKPFQSVLLLEKTTTMPSCAVITCKARSQVSSVAQGGISFHRFPKDRRLKYQWIKITGRKLWVPTKTSTICSRHFSEYDFITKSSGNRFLRMGAVPCQEIVKIHSNFETNDVLCTTEVKTERLEEPLSPANSLIGDNEEPQAEQLATIAIDPLTKHCSSSSDTESNASTAGRYKRRQDLREKEDTCTEHLDKIDALLKANRRLCQQNKNLKRVLMTMKKKIILLEEKNGKQSGDEESS